MNSYSELRKVDFADLSNLRFECFLGEVQSRSDRPVLVIRFAGEYRHGSAGEPDARFMFAMLAAAFQAWECWAVILDLSGLSYEWGDDIDGLWAMQPLQWAGGEYPMALIVGAQSERALASLYYDRNLERTSFSEPWVFRDMAAGLKHIEDELAKI